jgi:8-oxo-dGTP diphosphatase
MKPHLQIALALIWREGEVLLSKRLSSADHLPDVWEFPGGKVEEGESPALAAVREAREEVGLDVEVMSQRQPIEWEYETRRVTLLPFDCRIVGGEASAIQVAKVRFVAPSHLNPADFPPANAALIVELQRGAGLPDDALTGA